VPTTIPVTNLNDSGGGSLREAIQYANAWTGGSVDITFDSSLSGQIVLESALDPLKNDITITGTGNVSVARDQNCGSNFAIFTINGTYNCEIDYLGISGGTESGIVNYGSLIINSCQIAQNSATTTGGGIYNDDGTVNLVGCTVENNSAGTNGGGIYNESGTIYCSNCIISYNSANSGGGIYNDSNTGKIQLSTGTEVVRNSAATDGGGIYNFGKVEMNGGYLSYNTAGRNGGGLYDVTSAVSVNFSNVQITNNSAIAATSKGGGFDLEGGAATFNTCTISGNTANTGTGIAWSTANASYTATNCTITDSVVSF
jgi:predicted outer membrane repeat protein